MLGLRSTVKYFVISFAAIILSLLTASLAVAQTPATAAVEKATIEPSAVVPETAAKIPVASTAKEEMPAAPPKTETEPAPSTPALSAQVAARRSAGAGDVGRAGRVESLMHASGGNAVAGPGLLWPGALGGSNRRCCSPESADTARIRMNRTRSSRPPSAGA